MDRSDLAVESMLNARGYRVSLAVLAAGAALGVACSAPGRFVIRVAPAEIQQRVAAKFPRSIKKLLFEVRLERPELDLAGDARPINVRLRVTALVAGSPVGYATATVAGGVRYDRVRTEFQLTDPTVVEFEASHLPARYAEAARTAADRAINQLLPSVPLYRLGNDKRLARALLKRAWVCDGELCLEMGL